MNDSGYVIILMTILFCLNIFHTGIQHYTAINKIKQMKAEIIAEIHMGCEQDGNAPDS